jgi:hypothetical protein
LPTLDLVNGCARRRTVSRPSLLDVNVIVALFDLGSTCHHESAHAGFVTHRGERLGHLAR